MGRISTIMRVNLRVLVLSAIVMLTASRAGAAAPSHGSGTLAGQRSDLRSPRAYRSLDEFQGLGVDRQLAVFAGTVLDVSEQPVTNVIVDLFIDGALAGTATTEGGGSYEIRVPYDSHRDTTVLLWYVPQSGRLLPKELVIRESRASKTNGLISPCVPRAEFMPGRQFRVYLLDPSNRNKDLAELNCLP
jgi:hypothetical protein